MMFHSYLDVEAEVGEQRLAVSYVNDYSSSYLMRAKCSSGGESDIWIYLYSEVAGTTNSYVFF